MTDFIDQSPARIRKNPLGPVTVNQAHANIEQVDRLALSEHFSDGQHNAQEVPWVLGHADGATTGYLFDSAYGGTLARPATGELTVSVASGVIASASGLGGADFPAASVLANVSDPAIATYPHQVDVEVVSATSIKLRTRYMSSTLGSPGNSWASVAAEADVAIHAQAQPQDASLLASHTVKVRRDFLTEAATDWNALVENQGIVRAAMMREHEFNGVHAADRIAKASGWFKPIAGPGYSVLLGNNIKGVSRISAGVIEVEHDFTFASTNLAACFPQAQPSTENELVIVNGRCTTTTKFRFYIYVYSVSENKWTRDDRSFFAALFGRLA